MGRRYEVVVVGGGPSGSAAAECCAKAGLTTLLIEEQAHIGIPIQCAGLLSSSAFEECRVSRRCVLNTVSGATIIGSTCSLSFDAGKTMAYVVDRSILDQDMAYSAANAGADLAVKTRASGLEIRDHTLVTSGVNGKEEISYQVLIAADGPRATIGRLAGLPRAPVYLSGLQADVPLNTDMEKVAIYPNASPEFFGWTIPLGPGRARVGLCGMTRVGEKFERFVSQFAHKEIHFVSGTIPLGTLRRSTAEGIMAVGDAAALAKPTSGGGIYTGVRSARHAARVAAESCEKADTSESFLSRYEKLWKKDFGGELRKGYLAFQARQQINPDTMDTLISRMSDPSVCDLIVRKGDMDRPGRLIRSLMLHPALYSTAADLAGTYLRSLLTR